MDLVTGAGGFLGSHIAEALAARGRQLRLVIRSTPDTQGRIDPPPETIRADLATSPVIEEACRGVDVIYHAAARVSDWGPWEAFYKDTVQATENLARAALRASVRRFVHISSVSAYGNPNGRGAVIHEGSPLNVSTYRWNHYAKAKALAEEVLWRMHREEGLPLTVLRPAWIYGPRDRTALPRFHRMLTNGVLSIMGDGENHMGATFAPNLADACILAAESDRAVGEAFNCADDVGMTQREFLGLWADAFGCPRPTRTVPYGVAQAAGFACECAGRILRLRKSPPLTRQAVWVIGRQASFPTNKIREELGWRPKTDTPNAIRLTAQWYTDFLKANPP